MNVHEKSYDLKKDICINYLLALLVKKIIFFIIYLFKMGEKFTNSYEKIFRYRLMLCKCADLQIKISKNLEKGRNLSKNFLLLNYLKSLLISKYLKNTVNYKIRDYF